MGYLYRIIQGKWAASSESESKALANRRENARHAAELLIVQAQAEISSQLGNSDSHDTKAVGLLAIDLGAMALLVTQHKDLNSIWWIPAVCFGASALCFVWTAQIREYEVGPKVPLFYEQFYEFPPLEFNVQLMSDLWDYVEKNKSTDNNKKSWLWRGKAAMVVSLVASLVFLTPPITHFFGA